MANPSSNESSDDEVNPKKKAKTYSGTKQKLEEWKRYEMRQALEHPNILPPTPKSHFHGRYKNSPPVWEDYQFTEGSADPWKNLPSNVSFRDIHWKHPLPSGDTVNGKEALAKFREAQPPPSPPSPETKPSEEVEESSGGDRLEDDASDDLKDGDSDASDTSLEDECNDLKAGADKERVAQMILEARSDKGGLIEAVSKMTHKEENAVVQVVHDWVQNSMKVPAAEDVESQLLSALKDVESKLQSGLELAKTELGKTVLCPKDIGTAKHLLRAMEMEWKNLAGKDAHENIAEFMKKIDNKEFLDKPEAQNEFIEWADQQGFILRGKVKLAKNLVARMNLHLQLSGEALDQEGIASKTSKRREGILNDAGCLACLLTVIYDMGYNKPADGKKAVQRLGYYFDKPKYKDGSRSPPEGCYLRDHLHTTFQHNKKNILDAIPLLVLFLSMMALYHCEVKGSKFQDPEWTLWKACCEANFPAKSCNMLNYAGNEILLPGASEQMARSNNVRFHTYLSHSMVVNPINEKTVHKEGAWFADYTLNSLTEGLADNKYNDSTTWDDIFNEQVQQAKNESHWLWRQWDALIGTGGREPMYQRIPVLEIDGRVKDLNLEPKKRTKAS